VSGDLGVELEGNWGTAWGGLLAEGEEDRRRSKSGIIRERGTLSQTKSMKGN